MIFKYLNFQIFKFIILIFILLILESSNLCLAQRVDTTWTKVMGGSMAEAFGANVLNGFTMSCASSDTSSDGNIYITTTTESNDFYLHKSLGSLDIWVIKMNKNGDTVWTKSFGGAQNDVPYMLRSTKDGGCIIVGKSGSDDLNFNGLNRGSSDGFILRLKPDGSVLWLKTYGGEEYDMLYDIRETPDSAFVACGETNSNTGDLTGTGVGMCWAIKVNAKDGKKIWSYTFLGPDHLSSPDYFLENFARLEVLSDNSGYIFAGYTTPMYSDPTKDDIFLVKVSSAGKWKWSKRCGSDNWDGIAAVVDGGSGSFYIAGIIGGSGKNVKQYYGGLHDIWLTKFKSDGTLDWERNYGGSDWDMVFDMKKDSWGNLYMVGFSRSVDKDFTFDKAYGGLDLVIIKTNASGDTIFTKRIGGPGSDVALGITLLDKIGSSFVISGKSDTKGGYVNQSFGNDDLWIVRFDDISAGIKNNKPDNNDISVYPNPTSDFVNVRLNSIGPDNTLINIVSITGERLMNYRGKANSIQKLNISSLPKGIYIMSIQRGAEYFYKKIIKN
jgi:hypothetical protein